MVEKMLFERLQEMLGVPVSGERPADFAPPAIILERTGEVLKDHLSTVTVAADSYGRTLVEAAELCDRLTDAVLRLADDDRVGAAWLGTSYNNSGGKEYRYKSVYYITQKVNNYGK